MKKVCKIFFIILFFAILVTPNIVWPFVKDNFAFANTENRILAKFPELTIENIDNIPGEIENFINDYAPFRKILVDVNTNVNKTAFNTVTNDIVLVGKDDWFFYRDENSVADMLGIPIFDEENLAYIVELLKAVRMVCCKNPDDFVLMIAPNKERIYEEYLPDCFKKKVPGGRTSAEVLVDYIRENSDIKVIYPKEELIEAKEKARTYYKIDTHWDLFGGFVGLKKMFDALDLEFEDPMEVELYEEDSLAGDLKNLAPLPDYYKETEIAVDGVHNIGDKFVARYYDGDFTGDGTGCIRAYSLAPRSNKKMIMIRDSFAVNMMHVSTQYFKESNYIHWEGMDKTDSEYFFGDIFVYEVLERNLSTLITILEKILFKTAPPIS